MFYYTIMKNNISLYNISQEFIQLYEQIESGNGELTPELEAALTLNESNLAQKSVKYYFFMKDVLARIEQGKQYLEDMKTKIKNLERCYERCESNIIGAMQLTGKTEVGDVFHKFKLRKSESVEVTDLGLIPKKWKIVKVEEKPDKNALKAALKSGKKIAGCYLKENDNLQIK